MKVVGVSTEVSNDRDDLLENAWDLFFKSEVLDYLDGKNLSADIISVYYNYQGDHTKPYSLLIGYEVDESFETPMGVEDVIINLNHEQHRLEGEDTEAVIEKWQEIWDDNSRERAYIADFDRFNPIEDFIEINVEYKN